MPAISKATAEEIRECGLAVRKALYLVEGLWKGIRIFVPGVYRKAFDDALQFLHDSLSDLREPLIGAGVPSITEEELEITGGPPGGGKGGGG